MFFKKSLKKLEEEIKPYLKLGDYFHAGELARENGYNELAKKYYNISTNKIRKENFLKKISPSEEDHLNLLKEMYSIDQDVADIITINTKPLKTLSPIELYDKSRKSTRN